MPNLMLTNWCNYKCSYCFGMDMMAPKVEAEAMSDAVFLGILNWLEKTNYKRPIHLMGGEPTLHPKFEWIVNTLLEQDHTITIFSNLATEKAPLYSEKLADLPITWVVNINPPYKWTSEQQVRIRRSLQNLGKAASITFNIMPNEDDNEWAINLIEEFNLARNIKVGFVLPTYNQSNYALNDNEYKIVAEKVVQLAQMAEKKDIKLEYECGVPTCAFTNEQLGILWRCGSAVRSGCCSRLDITPFGDVIYCLPLATVASKKYDEFKNYEDARSWFETIFAPYRRLGRISDCATCNLMKPQLCNGACLAKNLIGVKNLKIESK